MNSHNEINKNCLTSQINEMVLKDHNPDVFAKHGGVETNIDLRIDRIHDLIQYNEDLNRESNDPTNTIRP